MPNQSPTLVPEQVSSHFNRNGTLPQRANESSYQEVSTKKRGHLRGIRYTISDAALLTLTDAAEILPGRCSTNRDWIERNVEKIYSPSMRALYRWGDIVTAMKEAA